MPMCCNFNAVNSFFDVSINVAKVSFPFNKAVLSALSSFFNFDNGTLALDDFEPAEFVVFINVLFIRSFELKMNSVASVLELAVRFGIISIVDHCEKLLMECGRYSKPCLTERLVLATDYSLKNLQARCLRLCTSPVVVKHVMESPFYKDLSSEGKLLLLPRMMEVLPKSLWGSESSFVNNLPLHTPSFQSCRSRRRQTRNQIHRPIEVVATNENQFVDNLYRTTAEPICSGYEVKKTISLAFSIDSMDHVQTSEHVLVASHLKWYLYVKQLKNGGENYIAAYVACDDVKKYPVTYEAVITLEAELTRKRASTHMASSYDGPTCTNGHWLIPSGELLKHHEIFKTNEKVTVTAELKVSMPMCYNFNAMKTFSDVTIKIGKLSFPFSKAGLSMHSSFFKAMFFGSFKESHEDVVTLEDVEPVAFVTLVNFLFVRSFELKMNSVASVLDLADRFGMISIVDHLEKLLMKCEIDSEPCLTERIILATKYSLKNLQKRCLELCYSMEVIKQVMKSPFYKDLSFEGKAMVLDRVQELV